MRAVEDTRGLGQLALLASGSRPGQARDLAGLGLMDLASPPWSARRRRAFL